MTSEGRSDMMVSKILLVDEKWLEKQLPLVAVPKRPEDFDGVYGEKERFWDPDGDTYSIDNNEGSEQGLDVHADVYELVDELERYTSAVDYATPNDLRPLSVAKQYLDGILSTVYEMMEEERDFFKAEEKVRRASAGQPPAPVIGEVIKTIACDSTRDQRLCKSCTRRVSAPSSCRDCPRRDCDSHRGRTPSSDQ